MMVRSEDGSLAAVKDVCEDTGDITFDANHPMAGKVRHYVVEVIDVREADPEELAHGHVHEPGGHVH